MDATHYEVVLTVGQHWLPALGVVVALAVWWASMLWLARAPRDQDSEQTGTSSLPDESEETW